MNENENENASEKEETNASNPSVSTEKNDATGETTKVFRAYNESMEVFDKIVMFNFSVGRKANDVMRIMKEIYSKFKDLNDDPKLNTGLRGRLVVGFAPTGGKFKTVAAECDVVDGNNKTSFNIRSSSEEPGVITVTECRPGVLSVAGDGGVDDEIKTFRFKKTDLSAVMGKVRGEYDDFIRSLSATEGGLLSSIDDI